MDATTTISIIGGLVGVGGVAGAVVAVAKLRPEAGQIVVKSAEGAVIVQSGVIDDLQDEIKRLQVRLAEVETTARDAHVQAEERKSENDYLKRRVSLLEAENIELREQVSIVQDKQNGTQHPERG